MAKAKVNKAEKVRDYETEHPDAKPIEVAKALKEFGVTASYVSNVRAKMKKRGRGPSKSRRGRPMVIAAETNGSAESIVSAAKFIKSCGGLEQAREAFRTAERVVATIQS